MSANDWQCNMLHLNDDCFFEVYKQLPTIDWCSLRETCTRLRDISDVCFQHQLESIEIKATELPDEPFSYAKRRPDVTLMECKVKFMYSSKIDFLPVKDVKNLFRNFGQYMTKVTLHGCRWVRDDFTKLLRLTGRYCIELRDLKLVKIYFDSDVIEECKTIEGGKERHLFSNLHRLVIIVKLRHGDERICDELTFSTCLSHCGSSLKELELFGFSEIDGKYLANSFKALETFTVKYSFELKYVFMREFFVKNPQLKSLNIVTTEMDGWNFTTAQMVQDICYYLPNLEEFKLCNVTGSMNCTKLKQLELDVGQNIDLNPLLIPLGLYQNIQKLHLASIEMNDEITQTICGFKTLNVLKLSFIDGLNAIKYKKLASEVPSLVELYIFRLSFEYSAFQTFLHYCNAKKIILWNFTTPKLPFILAVHKIENLCIYLREDQVNFINRKFGHQKQFFPLPEEIVDDHADQEEKLLRDYDGYGPRKSLFDQIEL